MIEVLVGGFLLSGSVCIIGGDQLRQCREVPAITFGNKYACDNRMETILEEFPKIPSQWFGFPEGERLRVHVSCRATMAGI